VFLAQIFLFWEGLRSALLVRLAQSPRLALTFLTLLLLRRKLTLVSFAEDALY
jgi:hypothetical protein